MKTIASIWASLTALALAGCTALSSGESNRRTPPLPEVDLIQARIIYIAEAHDNASHHLLQEESIRALHRRRQAVTVGMEMIDVTQQPVLDQYLKKKISWGEFSRQTGFDRGWGRTSPAYQRILAWCRRNNVPVVGLNAPPSVTRKIAQGKKLTAAEKLSIPSFPAPAGGFKKFRAAMAGHPGSPGSLRRYYEAQRAWDTTMAGRILAWLPDHPGTMIVLLGRFHADPQTGVPWYVGKKTKINQVIIRPSE